MEKQIRTLDEWIKDLNNEIYYLREKRLNNRELELLNYITQCSKNGISIPDEIKIEYKIISGILKNEEEVYFD